MCNVPDEVRSAIEDGLAAFVVKYSVYGEEISEDVIARATAARVWLDSLPQAPEPDWRTTLRKRPTSPDESQLTDD